MKFKSTVNFQNPEFKNFPLVVKIDVILQVFEKYFALNGNYHLIINFVDQETMAEINLQYYPFKKISDVLTFPSPKHFLVGEIVYPWGEIYFCPQVIKQQAVKDKTSFLLKKSAQLLVHALLHLFNYHHQDLANQQLVNSLSQEILQLVKIK